jgi:hypothetical protein
MTSNYVYSNPMSGAQASGSVLGEIRVWSPQYIDSMVTNIQILYGTENLLVTTSQGSCYPGPYTCASTTIRNNVTGAHMDTSMDLTHWQSSTSGDTSLAQSPAMTFFAAMVDDMGGLDLHFYLAQTYGAPYSGATKGGPPGMDDPIHDDITEITAPAAAFEIFGCYDADGECADDYLDCVDCSDGPDGGGSGSMGTGGGPYSGDAPTSSSSFCNENPGDMVIRWALGMTRAEAQYNARFKADVECGTVGTCRSCCGWLGSDGLLDHADPAFDCMCVPYSDFLCACRVGGQFCRQ